MNTRSIRFRLTVWYAGLLTTLLALFGISVYFGLARYLEWSLKDSLAKQAQQIAVSHLADVGSTGEDYVIGEIREHYAPEINSRFVRVTRGDGSLMYVSGVPQDGSFDPTGLTLPTDINEAQAREVHLPQGDGEVLLYAMPFVARDGSRFIVETGAPYDQVESVLHGLLLTLARLDQIAQELKSQEAQARALVEGARRIAAEAPVKLVAAQQADTAARAQYKFGLATITEVADAQRLLTQAEIDVAASRLSLWQALLAVARAQGTIEPFLQQVTNSHTPTVQSNAPKE